MSETLQEPVVEQPKDSLESEVSEPIQGITPATSIETKETVAEVPVQELKEELNYYH